MEQHINKINATTRDYRGNKSVLNQRVIEGVTSGYDLSTDLQLEENTSKTIVINNVLGGKIFLPNALTLLSGWKITIINESTDEDCGIYYYNSDSLFTSVAKNKMTEIIFLGTENDLDQQGKWKVVILSESVINDTDIYTTNIYSTTKVDFTDLGASFTYNTILAKINKNTPIKSIYVKTDQQFSGVNVNLNIGLLNNLSYFYDNLSLNADLVQRDLFNEVIDPSSDQLIIGNFVIPGATTNNWTAITSDIVETTTGAFFNGTNYVLQSDDTLYVTNTLSANITFQTKSIADFGFDSYSEYSLQYEQQTGLFYFFGVKDGRICYTTSQDGLIWNSELTQNDEIDVDNIKFITKIYNETNDKWFITATKDSNPYMIYVDDITIPATWSRYELKYNDTFIENINNIACDFSNLVINTNTVTYYSTDNGVTLNLLETYSNSEIYKFKYINNRWIRFIYNDANSNSFKYTFEFDTNINNWTEKILPDDIINNSDINYMLDINYTNGIWSIFRAYQSLEQQNFDLIISTDFFNTILTINTADFGGKNLTCICGDGSKGYLLTGEDGMLSYSNVSSSFTSLTQGIVEIIIEYADNINPINLLNPIIQGQIMPLGTVIHYPFVRTLPAGYIRLDGSKIKNVRNDFPEFYELLMSNPQIVYGQMSISGEYDYRSDGGFDGSYYDISQDTGNNSQWKQLVASNDGNFPKFVWVDAEHNDIRCPVINCFIRGFVGDITSNFAKYYQDGLPNITGQFETHTWKDFIQQYGAFNIYKENTQKRNIGSGGDYYSTWNEFDASRSNSIYGRTNEVRPKNITYPYIMSYYHTIQNTGTYNLQTMGKLLEKLDADIILAQNTVNDITRKVPAGTIVPFGGNDLPLGWLWCNGGSYLRSTYVDLFDKIGIIYGAADDEHFYVPDISDNRFVEGSSNNSNTLKSAGLPNITGTHTIVGAKYLAASGCFQVNNASSNAWTDSHDREGKDRIISFNASRSSSIYGNSSTVQPKSIRLRYIIKY